MSEPFILPHPRKPGCWLVCLGGGTYEVTEGYLCSCDGFHFRGRCKHSDAVAEQVRKGRACPACDGSGRLALRMQYPGEAPPCSVCEGSGLRSKADAALLATFESRREEALRDLFR